MPPNSPSPSGSPLGSGYHPEQAAGDATSVGPVDIFNLPSGVGNQVILVAGEYHKPPAGLPSNVPRDKFLAANDFPQSGMTGVAYATIKDILADVIRKSYADPNYLSDLQQKLYDGGFYGSTPASRIPQGTWSAETKGAIVDSLLQSLEVSSTGVPSTWSEFLDKRQAAGQAASKTQVQQIEYTDEAEVVQAAQKAAEASIGRRLTTAEAEKFFQHFRGAQRSYATKKLDNTPRSSPVELSAPDLSGQAEQFVEQGFTPEVGAERGRTYVSALLDMLGVKGA